MIKAYNDGIDLHTTTAARLAGKPLKKNLRNFLQMKGSILDRLLKAQTLGMFMD